MTKEINVNDYIYIKLTDLGRREIRRQHNEIYKGSSLIPDCYIKPENDGWSKWQLHEVMRTFGHMMINGFNLPFETKVRLDG